jgi:hypothetical protein
MAAWPEGAGPASARWRDLQAEFDRWAAAGRSASLWWRDDDAEAPSTRLDRLLAVATQVPGGPLPLALAVIPARMDPALAARLADERHVSVLQHGWSHENHAPADERTMELGSHRPTAAILDELDRGRDQLERLIGWQFLPVLVPPWNRIAPTVARALPGRGYLGLSSSGPRQRRRRRNGRAPLPGAGERFSIANVHIDIFEWRPRARFIGTGRALGQAVRHLAARRLGLVDPDEPTGLMTHHRQHDAACWRFLERFLAVTAAHPAVRWLSAEQVFAPPAAPAPPRRRRAGGPR